MGVMPARIARLARGGLVFGRSLQSILKTRTLVALLSVILGVASVTAGLQFSEVTSREILRNIGSLTQGLVHIRQNTVLMRTSPAAQALAPGDGAIAASLSSEDVEMLSQTLPYVRAATPVSRSYLPIDEHGDVRAIACAGVWPAFTQATGAWLVRGRFLAPVEEQRASRVGAIGTRLAEKLFPGVDPVGAWITVGKTPVRIIGVVAAPGEVESLDIENTFFLPYSLALELTTARDIADAILLRVDTAQDRRDMEGEIDRALAARHASRNYTIWSGREIAEQRRKLALAVEWAIRAGASLTLIVACIACGTIMTLLVNERRREIGVRKAVGASSYSIMLMIFRESAVLMTAGGLAGVAAGFLIGTSMLAAIPPGTLLDASLPWAVSGSIVLQSIQVVGIAAVAASIFPAWRAARMEPALALYD